MNEWKKDAPYPASPHFHESRAYKGIPHPINAIMGGGVLSSFHPGADIVKSTLGTS